MTNICNKHIFSSTYFKNLTYSEIERWIHKYKKQLVGSAIATANSGIISKIVSAVTKHRSKHNFFIPSHIGSIIERNGEIYIFDMKPPRAKCTLLIDYLLNTKDKFYIVIRDFDINAQDFSKYILKFDGNIYAYISAIECAFTLTKWLPNIKNHCSELHIRALQQQGLFLNKIADDLTPVETFEILIFEI